MIDRVINNYRIISVVAEGGMGKVYLAQHPFMGRRAAIKVLRERFLEDKSIVTRFVNEARAANAIHHPNIVEIIDVGYLPEGPPYLMMEFLEGETLDQRLVRLGRLSVDEAVAIVDQAASALEAAHAAGIIHRDLKPENLFLVPDPAAPGGSRVKVVDFGIAKLMEAKFGSMADTAEGPMGTPSYMSPEQCRSGHQDHRVDVYALGAILYRMTCGKPPFVAGNPMDVMMMHVAKVPSAPRVLFPDLPAVLEQVALRALAKNPDDRFPSMTALRAALEPLLGAAKRSVAIADTTASLAPAPRPAILGAAWRRRAPSIGLAVALGLAGVWFAATRWLVPRTSAITVGGDEHAFHGAAIRGCGSLGTSPCSACIAANCCREYEACQGSASCKHALDKYNGCMHRSDADRAAICSEQFGTDANREARELASCAFVRQGGPKVKLGRCAEECEKDSISDDACAAYCSCMAGTCRAVMDPLSCPAMCARLTADQVSCRTYHCFLASRTSSELHCQHATGLLQVCE